MCQICCVFKPANHMSLVTSGLISVDSHRCLFDFDCFIFSQSVLLLWVAHRCPNFRRSGSHDRKKRRHQRRLSEAIICFGRKDWCKKLILTHCQIFVKVRVCRYIMLYCYYIILLAVSLLRLALKDLGLCFSPH